MSGETVLVTGGSGFVGGHCILQLLAAGYTVRTTVRSLDREAEVRATLASADAGALERLSFVAADLLDDAGWAEAVAGVDYVLHVASPFPTTQPKDENELIAPAREGALRVLRAARDAGVTRVVLTSSFAAVGYSKPPAGGIFTEANWTDPTDNVTAYVKSKTLAERAAWDFIAAEGGALELAVINPVGILGPTLGTDLSSSIELVAGLLKGAMPGMPKLSFGIVDVRDVAAAHLLAMTNPAAAGERFLAIAGAPMTIPEVAEVLRTRVPAAAAKVPTRILPNLLVRVLSIGVPRLRELVPQLGKVKVASNEKARTILGWEPRSNEDAIVATAESLEALGILDA